MKRPADGVERLVQVLAKNASVVAQAFAGPVHGGDRARDLQIQELVDVGALRPFDEDAFYLTSGLHDYFSVALASFHAFQALTRIDSFLRQAGRQWDELLQLKASGASKDMAKLEDGLQRTIFDIGDTVERNIQLLNTMVLGQYGNVDSFESKLRQNRFYAREVQNSVTELQKLEAFVEKMGDAALATGLPRVRQLVNRRLGNKLFDWTSRLKDAQSVISTRLFEATRTEERVRQLSRYAAWLGANRTAQGWEVDVQDDVGPALLRPEPISFRPQPDTNTSDSQVLEQLVSLANKLKPQAVRRRRVDDEAETLVLSEDMEEVPIQLSPHQAAVRQLREKLGAGAGALSLREWWQQREDLASLRIDHWLLYAISQLQADGHDLQFIGPAVADPFTINETFYDVVVTPAGGFA